MRKRTGKKMKDMDTKVDMETTGTKTHGTIKGRETMIITEDSRRILIKEEVSSKTTN